MRGTLLRVGCMPLLDAAAFSPTPPHAATPIPFLYLSAGRRRDYHDTPSRGRARGLDTPVASGTTHARSITEQLSYHSFRYLTPGITRRPATLKIDESRRVGGRVHAIVRLRCPVTSHATRLIHSCHATVPFVALSASSTAASRDGKAKDPETNLPRSTVDPNST
jgi:hypothetical protein